MAQFSKGTFNFYKHCSMMGWNFHGTDSNICIYVVNQLCYEITIYHEIDI